MAADGRPSSPSTVDARQVITGDGVVVDLLDVFQPDWMKPASTDEETRSLSCLPIGKSPSLVIVVITAVIFVLFFLSVALKAYIHRARVRTISGIRDLPYSDRLKNLGLETLERRRLVHDLVFI